MSPAQDAGPISTITALKRSAGVAPHLYCFIMTADRGSQIAAGERVGK